MDTFGKVLAGVWQSSPDNFKESFDKMLATVTFEFEAVRKGEHFVDIENNQKLFMVKSEHVLLVLEKLGIHTSENEPSKVSLKHRGKSRR